LKKRIAASQREKVLRRRGCRRSGPIQRERFAVTDSNEKEAF